MPSDLDKDEYMAKGKQKQGMCGDPDKDEYVAGGRVAEMTREEADGVVAKLRKKATRRGTVMVGSSVASYQLKDVLEEQLGEREKKMANVIQDVSAARDQIQIELERSKEQLAMIVQLKREAKL